MLARIMGSLKHPLLFSVRLFCWSASCAQSTLLDAWFLEMGQQADKERYAAFGKIKGLLTSASEELHDAPLYYNLHAVCKTLHVTPPSGDIVRSALINAGTFPAP